MPQDPFIRQSSPDYTRPRRSSRRNISRASRRIDTRPRSRLCAICNRTNIEFTLKRLREPIDADNHGG
jgi:hypothetical protein